MLLVVVEDDFGEVTDDDDEVAAVGDFTSFVVETRVRTTLAPLPLPVVVFDETEAVSEMLLVEIEPVSERGVGTTEDGCDSAAATASPSPAAGPAAIVETLLLVDTEETTDILDA